MRKSVVAGGIIVIIVAIAIGLALAYTPPTGMAAAQGKTVKIGVLADLSGDYANVLRGGPRGAQIAAAELQKEGIDVMLFVEDQKSCDTKETISIMRKFTSIDNVDFVIGGTCSSTTLAAAPIAEETQTVMISAISSAPSVSDAGDYIFRTYPSDAAKGVAIARLAYEHGHRDMALLVDNSNDASIEVAQWAKREFESLGGHITIEDTVGKDDNDIRTQTTKFKAAQPDAVFYSITGPRKVGIFLKRAEELGLDVPKYALLETTEDAQVLKIAGDAAEGTVYGVPGSPPDNAANQKAAKAYRERFDEAPPAYFFEGYDATVMGVQAVLANTGGREELPAVLSRISQDFEGASGNVAFDEHGDVDKDIVLKTVRDGQFVPLK